jgi:hypothetical protein
MENSDIILTWCHDCQKKVLSNRITFVDIIYSICIDCEIERHNQEIITLTNRIKELYELKKKLGDKL